MQAVDRTRFDGLFDLTDLEKYLFIVRPPAGDLRIVRSGQLPPMALVSSLLGFFYWLRMPVVPVTAVSETWV
jgi:hypothetical protein